jgi:hypothetical protein
MLLESAFEAKLEFTMERGVAGGPNGSDRKIDPGSWP